MEVTPTEEYPILRVVDMVFRADHREAFLTLFAEHQQAIAERPGCGGVVLVERALESDEEVGFSTVSRWRSVEDLDAYRRSELFGVVWPATKRLFARSPRATSYARTM